MADIWDGQTATVGILAYAYNTDGTAIRFFRTDGLAFPVGFGDEVLELVASKLDVVDTTPPPAGSCMTDLLLERQGWGDQVTGGACAEEVIIASVETLREALE